MIITIDGPSGAGKGTLALRLAEHFNFTLLDSGALYRIVALDSLDSLNKDLHSEEFANSKSDLSRPAWQVFSEREIECLVERIPHLEIVFKANEQVQGNGFAQQIILNGRDVTEAIRQEVVGMRASQVAALSPIRDALLGKQRQFAAIDGAKGLVADGRDMGTVVFPDAKLKIFLDARAEVRASRRLKQLGQDQSYYQAILEAIEKRDRQDRQRKDAPLRPADDAHIIDASEISADQVFGKVVRLAESFVN